MEHKHRVEVTFSKNRNYPEYGKSTYNIESYVVTIPYGKKHNFKNLVSLIIYVKSIVNKEVLDKFDNVRISKMIGYSGSCEYLKENNTCNDALPIDKEFINSLFN